MFDLRISFWIRTNLVYCSQHRNVNVEVRTNSELTALPPKRIISRQRFKRIMALVACSSILFLHAGWGSVQGDHTHMAPRAHEAYAQAMAPKPQVTDQDQMVE